MGAPLPPQPNPNPNNKVMQQFKTSSMPAYSISPLSCNNLHLQLGRVVEPIVFEDGPHSMIDEGMNPWFENSFSLEIPIIEDAETLVETLIEIHGETSTDTLAETHTKSQPT